MSKNAVNPPRGQRRAAGRQALPVRPAGLVEVHVRIEPAGEHVQAGARRSRARRPRGSGSTAAIAPSTTPTSALDHAVGRAPPSRRADDVIVRDAHREAGRRPRSPARRRPRVTDSSGWWLIPPAQRTKSIAMSVTRGHRDRVVAGAARQFADRDAQSPRPRRPAARPARGCRASRRARAIGDHVAVMPRRAQIASVSRLQRGDRAARGRRRPGGGCRASRATWPGIDVAGAVGDAELADGGHQARARRARRARPRARTRRRRRARRGAGPSASCRVAGVALEDEVEARLAGDRGHDAERQRPRPRAPGPARCGPRSRRGRPAKSGSPSGAPIASRERDPVADRAGRARSGSSRPTKRAAAEERRLEAQALLVGERDDLERRRRSPRPRRGRRARRGCRRSGRRRRPSPGASRSPAPGPAPRRPARLPSASTAGLQAGGLHPLAHAAHRRGAATARRAGA